MIKRDADAADVRVPPPLVYVAALVAGVLLHLFVYPLTLPFPLPVSIVGTLLAGGAGALLLMAALVAFLRTGQDPKPWKTTPEFIGTGVYRVSRNPMYTGMALVLTALAFALTNGWLLAFVPVVLAVVYRTAIRHEETYLDEKFGDSYRAYKRSVRRWL